MIKKIQKVLTNNLSKDKNTEFIWLYSQQITFKNQEKHEDGWNIHIYMWPIMTIITTLLKTKIKMKCWMTSTRKIKEKCWGFQ